MMRHGDLNFETQVKFGWGGKVFLHLSDISNFIAKKQFNKLNDKKRVFQISIKCAFNLALTNCMFFLVILIFSKIIYFFYGPRAKLFYVFSMFLFILSFKQVFLNLEITWPVLLSSIKYAPTGQIHTVGQMHPAIRCLNE